RGGEQRRELAVLLRPQLEEPKHPGAAALRVGGGPCGLCGCRFGDRLSDLGLGREGDLGLHFAGIGVVDVAGASGLALDLLAADEMADFSHSALPAISKAGPNGARSTSLTMR